MRGDRHQSEDLPSVDERRRGEGRWSTAGPSAERGGAGRGAAGMPCTRFASLPPAQIVPRLADEGVYLASESTFYRVLHEADQQHHRGRAAAPNRKGPSSHEATGPNQVWCWDITYLPSAIRGLYFYLYLVLDVYSRKIVGWEVHATESGKQAAQLLQRTALSEAIQTWRQPLVLHAGNGAPMKSATLLATLQWLGVTPSHSRPRVSNDNAYAESLFRTCKCGGVVTSGIGHCRPACGSTRKEAAVRWHKPRE